MSVLFVHLLQWQHPGLAPMSMHMHMGSMSMGHLAYPPEASAAGLNMAASGGPGDLEPGGLTETSSVKPSDTIRAEHLICSAELELNQPIGIGAEGKVRGTLLLLLGGLWVQGVQAGLKVRTVVCVRVEDRHALARAGGSGSCQRLTRGLGNNLAAVQLVQTCLCLCHDPCVHVCVVLLLPP